MSRATDPLTDPLIGEASAPKSAARSKPFRTLPTTNGAEPECSAAKEGTQERRTMRLRNVTAHSLI